MSWFFGKEAYVQIKVITGRHPVPADSWLARTAGLPRLCRFRYSFPPEKPMHRPIDDDPNGLSQASTDNFEIIIFEFRIIVVPLCCNT